MSDEHPNPSPAPTPKADRAKQRTMAKYGDSMKSSLGFHRTPGTPAGMAPPASAVGARMAGVVNDRDAAVIAVDRIVADPEQPRRAFDDEAIDRLADSLRTRGQLQNVVVYWSEDLASYVLVSGERRWRAARKGGLATLRCKILDRRPDDPDRLSLQLIENCVREDLRPVEQAAAFRALMQAHGWSTRQLADALHMPQAKVVYALGLLELPGDLRERVDAGRLAPRTAYEIGRLGDADDQRALADRVAAEGLTRDDVLAEVRALRDEAAAPETLPAAGPPGGPSSWWKETPKGRGGASSSSRPRSRSRKSQDPRLPTTRAFRLPGGGKLTLDRPRGLDAETYRRAARLLIEQADRLDLAHLGPPAASGGLAAGAGSAPAPAPDAAPPPTGTDTDAPTDSPPGSTQAA